jgi:hypothetical protein
MKSKPADPLLFGQQQALIDWQELEQFLQAIGRSAGPLVLALFPPDPSKPCIHFPCDVEAMPWQQIEAKQRREPELALGLVMNHALQRPADWGSKPEHLNKLGNLKAWGASDKHISQAIGIWGECDGGLSIQEQQALPGAAGLPEPTLTVWTGNKSLHMYWLLQPGELLEPCQFRELQQRLAEALANASPTAGADRSIHNPARLMRAPGGIHPATGNRCTIHGGSGKRFTVAALLAMLPAPEPAITKRPGVQQPLPQLQDAIPLHELLPRELERLALEGADKGGADKGGDHGRNNGAFKLAAAAFAIAPAAAAAGLRVDGTPESLVLDFAARCRPPLEEREAMACIESARGRNPIPDAGWPERLRFHLNRAHQRPQPTPPMNGEAFIPANAPSNGSTPWGQGDTPAEQPAGGQGGEEPQRESVLATFRELIQSAYMAVLADDLDSEMAAVAELKTRFRATDQQISRRMIEAHLAKRVKKAARQGDGVDLSAVQALTYRQDGFTIAGDVCLTYGSFGTGKTTYTVAKIIALCKGEGFLDRSAPCEPGKALFIATDSGAPALKKTLADLEIDPNTHPLFKGPEQRIWIWAHAPEQGHEAWVCDLRGLVKLEQFIEEKGIDLVVIDSAKSVSSGAGWQYTDNDAVKVLLRYMREAVAAPTGCSIEFISHDGTQAGSHSGAKAWAEDPSMVVALTPIRDAADESKVTAIKAEFKKDRAAVVDPRRFVRYRLTDGRLELVEGSEVVGNCADGVLQILSEAHARGHQSLTAKAIDEEAFALLRATSKTVRNTLVQLVNAKRLVKPAYGRYALSPGEMQARGTPLRPSREESPQNTGQERANPHSRPDSRREGREGGELPEDSRRESAGKVRESSSSNGSKKILPDKRGLGTPPAAADRPHPLVELVEVPPPPSSAGLLPLLARAAAAPAAPAPDLRTGDQVELLQSDGSWRNGWRVADVVATSIGTRYRIECGADFRSVGPAEVRLCEQQEAA